MVKTPSAGPPTRGRPGHRQHRARHAYGCCGQAL